MDGESGLAQEVRTWAMFSHLSALLGLFGNGIGFILGPLIVWLVKRKDHPFIDEHGREALNFQITVFLIMIAMMFLIVAVTLALPGTEFVPAVLLMLGFFAVGIADVVFTVIGAIRANAGEGYRYPFSFRFIN
jgi:uncharacterized Tic20 family protein